MAFSGYTLYMNKYILCMSTIIISTLKKTIYLQARLLVVNHAGSVETALTQKLEVRAGNDVTSELTAFQ